MNINYLRAALVGICLNLLFLSNANAFFGYKDLEFNIKPMPYAGYIIPNSYFVPEKSKDQKHPAVIIVHTCGGVGYMTTATLTEWASVLVDAGYGVMVIDSLSDRIKNPGDNCNGMQRPVRQHRLVEDILDAATALAKSPLVDAERIFAVGFSLGAMSAGTAAGKVNKERPELRAVAGLYGGCIYESGKFGNEVWLDGSEDIPVLWLMGDKDYEAPPAKCASALQRLKSRIPETEFHLYEGATHGWDTKGMNGRVITAANGATQKYIYDPKITADSHSRVINFFNKFGQPK
jgi:dienelactone hydrolase